MAPDILVGIVMSTSIHLPKPLLAAVDRRAKSLRLSRNRLIVRALERELREDNDWTPGFFDRLREAGPGLSATVDAMVEHVRRGRRSKPARRL